jgi:ATP-dependent RNA helicase RhlE
VAPSGSAVKTVTQEVFFVEKSEKLNLLKEVLSEYKGSILIFSRTKHGARKIARTVRDMGHAATEIHSNRSLHQRIEALEGFKIGKYRILVATDIAARGIDVTGIEVVINYDIPATAEDYVHRIGRTARAGMAGHAISFATPDQKWEIRNIERLIKITLPVSSKSFAGSAPVMQRERERSTSFAPQRRGPSRFQGHNKHRPGGNRKRSSYGGNSTPYRSQGYFMKRPSSN